MPNRNTTRRKRRTWQETTPHAQLPIDAKASKTDISVDCTWYLDYDTPFYYGAVTTTHKPNKKPHSHYILFRTQRERAHYWDNTNTQWGTNTRFFRFRSPVKIVRRNDRGTDGIWMVLR